MVVPIEGWLDETCPSDNHVLCATGDATMSARWRYRVVCSDGAYVRGGLELSSPHLHASTSGNHGGARATVNEQGLAGCGPTTDGSANTSNFRDSAAPSSSRSRGREPKYRVVLQEGAVVRETVELSSPIVRCSVRRDIDDLRSNSARAGAERAFRPSSRARARCSASENSRGVPWLASRVPCPNSKTARGGLVSA